MTHTKKDLVAIMPCKNEADNLERSLVQLRDSGIKTIIVSIDPETNDDSAKIANKLECDVVFSPKSGYDHPMNTGTEFALKSYPGQPILYTDAGSKFSLEPLQDMLDLLNNGNQIVLGNRVDTIQAMSWHQKAGTKLIVLLINLIFRKKLVDISPFRIVSSEVFQKISMQPRKFRWTTEMLVKSLACDIPIGEVSVKSNKRLGDSKISGKIKNSILAGLEMLSSFRFIRYKGVSNGS